MTKIELPLSAISVRQPWAWLIVHGGKGVENRTWPTSKRGPVYIHAGKKFDRAGYLFLREHDIRMTGDFLTGGIIGVVDIIDCVQNSISPWAELGMWHWVLANPRPLEFIPCKGKLGFFRPEIGNDKD